MFELARWEWLLICLVGVVAVLLAWQWLNRKSG